MNSPAATNEVVIVDAVRSPVGRRNGSLAGVHANDLLGTVLAGVVDRVGVDALAYDRVVGACVQQVGAQASNVVRNAWLAAGLPIEVPATTVNAQCGSAQEALTGAHAFLASAMADLALVAGVETMSSIPMGSTVPDPALGMPRAGRYTDHHESTTQFEGADRIAAKYGIGRADTDAFGERSQRLAAQAWAEDRFAGQIVPIDLDGGVVDRDECLRETSLDALAGLRTNREADDAVHTAGTSSQIADGAAAAVLTTATHAAALGITPRARIVDSVTVGCDPVLMLEGPIPATAALLARTGLAIDDIDVFEINEAFASVVLAWAKATGAPMERVNPNGGAIALGHPLGATGVFLLAKALYELERTDGRYALISMCCGGGLGTGTIIERLDP